MEVEEGPALPAQTAEAEALGHKAAGNEHFKAGKWSAALVCYTAGIECAPTAVLLSNRAACHLKMESFGAAIVDADRAIALDPRYVKGHYRKGGASMGLGKLKQAAACYKKVCVLRPTDTGARKKLAACTRELKRERFAAAMRYDGDGGPGGSGASSYGSYAGASPRTAAASMTVPASYTGPHLPDGGVTLEFATALRVAYREEQVLAKKYVIDIVGQATAHFRNEPSLVDIAIPDGEDGLLTVCGDTHGQFYDLCNIFTTVGVKSFYFMFLV